MEKDPFFEKFCPKPWVFLQTIIFSTSRKWPRFSFDPSSWLAHLWAPSDHWFPTRGWPWPSVPYAPSFGPLPWEWAWGSAPRVKMVRSWDRNDEVNPQLTWLVVSTPLKNISQFGLVFPKYGKIKHVPNHQPMTFYLTFYPYSTHMYWFILHYK